MDTDALKLIRGDKGFIIWIDLDCPTEEETKRILENTCNFHPLAIEDCIQSNQLPKLDEYEDYLFMTMHSVDFTKESKFTISELDMFLGKDFLVTFHTVPVKSIQILKERLLKQSNLQVRGPDRLAHHVLDMMIDNYTSVLSGLSGQIEDLEDALLGPKKMDSLEDVLNMRKDLSSLRQIVQPQREVISRLARGENKFIRNTLWPYYRDLCDNLTRVDEIARSYTDRLVMDIDVYFNRAAYETNEGIKILTALTAITLPPALIGGWYGMNFQHMPELSHPSGYWVITSVTIISMIGMWLWLKTKKWF